MIKLHTLTGLVVCSAILLASCGQSAPDHEKTAPQDTVRHSYPLVTLVPVGNSPEFPDAKLSIQSVTAQKVGADSAHVTFNFAVKNYELKHQTSDSATKLCNNSAKGQHIHFILDENPYTALYEPTNGITLQNNTEHYLMAFLSRSYHESIKSKGAAVVYHFKIDEKGNLKKLADPKTPMVFYSRPKGDYIGKDTANVLLDFYVWNAGLSNDGYKVKAHIMNEGIKTQDTTVTITDWKPYFIQNLGQGKSQVTLSLVDKDGKTVEGPSTTATREFNLTAQEPMKP
ncbi:MAG: hypothetical protein H0X33_02220 [Taibaiella sp.]|nr:hypothetical protein [Taibaiella sp.]